MNLATRWALFAAAAGLTWFLVEREPPSTGAERSLARRVLGPFAGLAAAIEWARFDALWRAGEHGRAWVHADRALELAPEDPSGWIYLAHHAVYERAAPGLGLPRAERRQWVEIGLGLLDRGEQRSGAAGPIAFKRAIIYLSLASEPDEERALPIPAAEAWGRAAAAFERAAEAGEPIAAAAARMAREAASAAETPDTDD